MKQKKREEARQAETPSSRGSPKQPASAGWEHFVPDSKSIFFPPQPIQIHLTYLVTQNPLSFTFLAVA